MKPGSLCDPNVRLTPMVTRVTADPGRGSRKLVFVPRNAESDDLVARVAHLGSVSESGIVNGDVLLKVGELEIATWRMDPGAKWHRTDLCTPFGAPVTKSFPGNKLELTLGRNAEIVKVIVLPEEIAIFAPATNSLPSRSH